MIDELLGRAGLKQRIDSLETEKRHLERELDAESDRRADAVSDRQEAQQRVNRLEDRITELEDRVQRLTGFDADLTFRREATITGDRLDELLDRLDAFETGPEGVFTAYLADGHDLPHAARDAFGDHAGLVARAAPCLSVTDDASILGVCLSLPVPPDSFATWSDHVALDREWVEPTGEYALALVRSDLFALGEYDGRTRTAFHGFDADLKSQHSNGGFSQARFERLRDEQIDSHVERCKAAIAERDADRLYVVGERSLLSQFDTIADVTRSVDATGDPEPALNGALYEFWTVHLHAL